MRFINENKLVLFGAGKIGRSFIGQLFSSGGYEVVFIDYYKPIIDELNRRKKYKIIIKSDVDEIQWVENVRGIYSALDSEVAEEVATAGIMAVSVGQAGMPAIMHNIAKGLLKRYEIDHNRPLDIIIAENLRNASEFFEEGLRQFLPEWFPIRKQAGFVETSIGKMVPIMLRKDIEEDMLQIFAEPYNTLILDKNAFRNPIPNIKGLAPKENMKAWVDRKLFIHNLGHAATAYIGYINNPHFNFIYEPLESEVIFNQVRNIMLQAANLLINKYPDEFTHVALTDHIDDLLKRFQNKALGDTIFRVGCDLLRKLAKEDRLSGAIRLAFDLGLPYNSILYALVCGFHFRATDERGELFPDDRLFVRYYDQGIETVLEKVCGFDDYQVALLLDEVRSINSSI